MSECDGGTAERRGGKCIRHKVRERNPTVFERFHTHTHTPKPAFTYEWVLQAPSIHTDISSELHLCTDHQSRLNSLVCSSATWACLIFRSACRGCLLSDICPSFQLFSAPPVCVYVCVRSPVWGSTEKYCWPCTSVYTSLALFPYVGSSASVAVTWIMDVPAGEDRRGETEETGTGNAKGKREKKINK